MTNHNRDIGSEDYKIMDLVKELKEDKFLIPTFQREFVWQQNNISKLWDSIFKFYPIGSILYWETDSYLHTHRKLGGFEFPHDEDSVRKFKEWKYILDGQQRATSLLITLLGGRGKVENDQEFDFTIYFDAVKGEFFFANELEKRKKNYINEKFLIRLRDVPNWSFLYYGEIAAENGFTSEIESNLNQIDRIFSDYKIPVVRIKGVEVNEVCEIFERINQEGKRLDPVDIIVARTYQTENPEKNYSGFYLREYLKSFKEKLVQQGNRYQDLDDLTVIQMIALCRRKEDEETRSRYGITPASLQNLTAEDFEQHWVTSEKTILNTIKFLSDMKVHGPNLLPFTYIMLPLCYYLHKNSHPNKDVMRQWFWRTVFGLDEFRSSTAVYEYCEQFFRPLEEGKPYQIEPLRISIDKLIRTSYNYRNSLSRAVLAFLAYQNPLDFSDPHAVVLDNVYLLLSQAPNLHHIFPSSFLSNHLQGSDLSINSLMNICFLRAETNIKISDTDPLNYLKHYADSINGFEKILDSHLIPAKYLHYTTFSNEIYQSFLQERANFITEKLKDELQDVDVTIVK
ncbi:MAG: DUF262 domain-containing protein [Anaerolineaceae bacterium]|nr:DUF262 domain-containing protein [Anaerolineaceae bacterium]